MENNTNYISSMGKEKAAIIFQKSTEPIVNPREDCNAWEIAIFIKNMNLGDFPEMKSREEFFEMNPGVEVVTIYGYIHSGIALSLTDFKDRFDSGVAGYARLKRKDSKEKYSDFELESLAKEIAKYNEYLDGAEEPTYDVYRCDAESVEFITTIHESDIHYAAHIYDDMHPDQFIEIVNIVEMPNIFREPKLGYRKNESW